MEKSINIALDIETLSTRPTAAIISIAAKAFSFTSEEKLARTDFYQLVDASSCAMYGMHFDPQTIDWWSRRDEIARSPYLKGISDSINDVLLLLERWVDTVRDMSPDKTIHVWMQGTDFDAAILRNAYCVVFGDDSKMPWRHFELRDSRTFINAVIGAIKPELTNPYDAIPKNPSWVPHDVMSDVDNLIWNVKHVFQMIAPLSQQLSPTQP